MNDCEYQLQNNIQQLGCVCQEHIGTLDDLPGTFLLPPRGHCRLVERADNPRRDEHLRRKQRVSKYYCQRKDIYKCKRYVNGCVYLGDLPFVTLIRVLDIVLKWCWPGEFMVARWRSAYISLASDHARKPCNRASNWALALELSSHGTKWYYTLINLTEHHYSRKFCIRIAWDSRMEDIHSYSYGISIELDI